MNSYSPQRRILSLGTILLTAAVLLATFLWQTNARAEVNMVVQTVNIPAQADAAVDATNATTNYGSDPLAVSSNQRSFISFDLSDLPAGATILTATLKLNVAEATGADLPQPLGLSNVQGLWDEATLTADNAPTLSPPQSPMPVGAATETAEWDVTPLVNGWYNGNVDNFGLAVRGQTADYQVIFSSRETGTPPILEVVFEETENNEPRPDLGDAPDSTNHAGINNTAYVGVNGQFPTVFDDAVPGPRHNNETPEAVLGNGISREIEADQGPDQDGTNNILDGGDNADNDRQDDGWRNRNAPFNDCFETTLAVMVSKAAAASQEKMYLNVWFDGNRDGDWADTGSCAASDDAPAGQSYEWIVQDFVVDMSAIPAGGSVVIPVTTKRVMNSTPDGRHWMRFTLSDEPVPTGPNGLSDGRGPAAGYAFGETEDILQQPQVDGEPGQLTISKTVETVNDPAPFKEPVIYTIRLSHVGGTEPAFTQLIDPLGPYSRIVGKPEVTEISPGVTPLRAQVKYQTITETNLYQPVVRWRGALAPGAELEIKFKVIHASRALCNNEAATHIIENTVMAQQVNGDPLTATTSFEADCPAYSLDDIVVTQEIVGGFSAAGDLAYDTNAPEMIGGMLFIPGRTYVRTRVTNNSLSPLTLGFGTTLEGLGWTGCLTCTFDVNAAQIDAVPVFDTAEHKPDHYTSFRKRFIEPGQSIMFETVLRWPSSGGSLWYEKETLGWTGCLTCTDVLPPMVGDTASALNELNIPNPLVTFQQTYCILEPGQQTCPAPEPGSNEVAQTEPLEVELCRCDLGDAPASMNHASTDMLAYPTIKANFPTVFDTTVSSPNGPRHNYPDALHLGQRVSHETEADTGPDQDPRNNINPVPGAPNRDRGDDGIRPNQLNFTDCQRSSFNASVFINPQAKARLLEANQNAVVYLNVWVDGNRDGDWEDAAACAPVEGQPSTAVEHIVIDMAIPVSSLNGGTNLVPVMTGRVPWPANMAERPSWLRVTLSERPSNKTLVTDGITHGDGRGYDGTAFAIGETEDYLLRPAASAEAGADMAVAARGTAQVLSPRDAATGLPTGKRAFAIVYRIDFSNEGTETAQNVSLSGMLPTELVEADVEWTYLKIGDIQGEFMSNEDLWSMTIGDVPAGESGRLIIKTRVNEVWTDMRPLSVMVNSDNDVDDSNDADEAVIDMAALATPVEINPNVDLNVSPVIRGRAFPGAMVQLELKASGTETITAAFPANEETGYWAITLAEPVATALGGEEQFLIIATATAESYDNTPLFVTQDRLLVTNSAANDGRLVGLHFAANGQLANIEEYPQATDENGQVVPNGWRTTGFYLDDLIIGVVVDCEDPNAGVHFSGTPAGETEPAAELNLNLLRQNGSQKVFGIVLGLGNFEIQDLMSRITVVCDKVEASYTGTIVVMPDPAVVSDIRNGTPLEGATVAALHGYGTVAGLVAPTADVRAATATANFDGFFPWPGNEYGQDGSQMTAADGGFSFNTPSGVYRLSITKDGYQPYVTQDIQVTDNVLLEDVSLTPEITAAADHTIYITENGFEPAVLNVKPGDVIEWVNVDANDHSASGVILDSGLLGSGESYKYQVDTAEGTIAYSDLANPANDGYLLVDGATTLYLPMIIR
ncbi:MAG: DNRLRE domain-containing protein [Anaerolineales bacterium]|nr:DNRLRE domain-containing protein [Anaerolineales bacterium]